MKVLIVPDKFKGSLSANDVCDAIEKGIHNVDPSILITKIPLADGGEGSLSVLENTLNFERIYLEVNDPLFRPIKTYYGLDGSVAYIEMAKASGLQLLNKSEQNPMQASSLGTGELIIDAIKKGASVINLFVGGSSTNDAGIGMASAFGYEFKDKNNNLLEPIGANLNKVIKIDNSSEISFEQIKFNVLTDVKNPLFGKNGAAFVFAKQKGANNEEIIELDKGLINFSKVISSKFGIDISQITGGGAAGGISAGAVAFSNAKINSGIETILDLLNMNAHIEQSELVITGEGKLDNQTLDGKVVSGVIQRCRRLKTSFGIVCGENKLSEAELVNFSPGIIKSIMNNGILKEDAINNAETYLTKRAEEVMTDYLKYFF